MMAAVATIAAAVSVSNSLSGGDWQLDKVTAAEWVNSKKHGQSTLCAVQPISTFNDIPLLGLRPAP